jgi:pimeloyl-ACP methyl ester carboxylesterase
MKKRNKKGCLAAGAWLLSLLVITMGGCSLQSKPDAAEQVILLHGLGRSSNAMFLLQKRIRDAGYEAHSIEYESLQEPPEIILEKVGEQIALLCRDDSRPVHFVAHSLGGLIIRAYLDQRPAINLGRVVLLGTPSQGSELVDIYGDTWLFKVLGPTAHELGTDDDSFPNRIGPPFYPLGIIAGTSSFNPITDDHLPGADDGVVSVKSTKIDGMTDFMMVATSHSMMRYNETVANETIHFLKKGRFSQSSTTSNP